MRISDWSSDVCSSDLAPRPAQTEPASDRHRTASPGTVHRRIACFLRHGRASPVTDAYRPGGRSGAPAAPCGSPGLGVGFKGVRRDRKSVVAGKSGSVRVDLGGCRIIQKKKEKQYNKAKE